MFIFGNEQQTVVKSHFQSAHSSPVRRSARIATSLTMAVNCLTIQLETLANKLFPLAISCLWNLNLPLFHAKCGKRICSHGGNWLRSRHLCQRITAMKMIVFDRSLFLTFDIMSLSLLDFNGFLIGSGIILLLLMELHSDQGLNNMFLCVFKRYWLISYFIT
jgi:hypothetical protein